ncbi:hypothetical protein HMPREF0872_00265 [Veillonella montpellierensis DNF00314]|uniref:Phage protein n=1 Tax=Veillonella montpellierensis DNF00314 TaxID=1401067 RepID=A0A096BZ97_9FIRM|nr:hypothetical protein [Veillonella montpellierensis]KGF48077.1 hypothetical protein HMPREF0872_00265 [Veillonella montpellierensis DNF00314]
MIKLRHIQKALIDILKGSYPTYKVYFDNVEKSNVPYFYVEMFVHNGIGDDTYFNRTIQIDITFRTMEDTQGRIKRAELYDMSDSLECMFRPGIKVDDRYITINNFEHTFIDEVLHVIFNLEFEDAFTDKEVGFIQNEVIETLTLRLNGIHLNEEETNG